jgi:hypothetical protein
MPGQNWSRNQANDLKDHFDRPLIVGQTVCKPSMSGRSAVPEIRTVTRIENGKVYLDGAKSVALNYTGRIVILAQPGEVYPPETNDGE